MESCPEGRGCGGEGLMGENRRVVTRDPAKPLIVCLKQTPGWSCFLCLRLGTLPLAAGARITHPVVRAGQESPPSLGKEC